MRDRTFQTLGELNDQGAEIIPLERLLRTAIAARRNIAVFRYSLMSNPVALRLIAPLMEEDTPA